MNHAQYYEQFGFDPRLIPHIGTKPIPKYDRPCWPDVKATTVVPSVSSKRVRVYAVSNNCCVYCAVQLRYDDATWDHLIPVSKGGTSVFENLLCACSICNTRKSNSDAPLISFATNDQFVWLFKERQLYIDSVKFEQKNAAALSETAA